MVEQPIKLSSNLVVACPLKGFALRKVVACSKCEHLRGVDGNDEPMIICAKPLTRRTIEVIED